MEQLHTHRHGARKTLTILDHFPIIGWWKLYFSRQYEHHGVFIHRGMVYRTVVDTLEDDNGSVSIFVEALYIKLEWKLWCWNYLDKAPLPD